jgi:EAL domain-containing protein (putative c-di-GMP-specific phosphodiesterase class I)/CheY-like chemotaxis protein
LLIWLVVSIVTAPLIGIALRRAFGDDAVPPAVDTGVIDLREPSGQRRAVVVVIDDDAVGRILLASILSRAGYNTIEAPGGPEPIALPGDVHVDAIVVDHTSCVSRGEVLRRVRARSHQQVPPILMAQTADDPDAWIRAGADGYITQPFSPDDLVRALDAQLRRGAAWRSVFDSQAEEHAAVSRVMGATVGTDEPMSTAAAVCDALNATERVTGTALVSFAGEGPTVLATSGDPPWDVAEGPVVGQLADTLVRAAESGPQLSHRSSSPSLDLDDARPIAATAPLGSSSRPLGLLAARLAPSDAAAPGSKPDPEGTSLATTIHLAGVATDLLRPRLEDLTGDAAERRMLERVVDDRSFTPVFQPIVDLTDAGAIGYEALTRFTDGADPATRFHEAAALGVGIELEVATLLVALEHAPLVPAGRFIAFNVSPSFLVRDDALRALLHDVGRPVVVEISEHEAIADYDAVRSSFDRLDVDARLSVDDAGSGFASLRHILVLRPDFVKLDRSWVHGVHDDPARQALIAGVAHFVREIGAALLAEGIEAPEDRDVLVDLGVQYGQGWLFGRPEPVGSAAGRVAG